MSKSTRLLWDISQPQNYASTFFRDVDEMHVQEIDARSVQQDKRRLTVEFPAFPSTSGYSCYSSELSTALPASVSLPECAASSSQSGIYEAPVTEIDLRKDIEGLSATCITPSPYHYFCEHCVSQRASEIPLDTEVPDVGSSRQVNGFTQHETSFDSIKVGDNAIPGCQKYGVIYSYTSPMPLSDCGSKCYVSGRASKQALVEDSKQEPEGANKQVPQRANTQVFTSKKKHVKAYRIAKSIAKPDVVVNYGLSKNDEGQITKVYSEKYLKMRAQNRVSVKKYREKQKAAKVENERLRQNLLAKLEVLAETCDKQSKKIRFLEELVNLSYGPIGNTKP